MRDRKFFIDRLAVDKDKMREDSDKRSFLVV